jgi:hypothetical protein
MTFVDQLVVPVAVPDPPALFVQVTCVTATSSLAEPLSVTEPAVVAYVALDVGLVMLTAGACVSGGGGEPGAPPTAVFMSV